MPSEDWIERLRTGDHSVLGEIWEHYGEELRRRARSRLRQYCITHEAESMDICNAVLMDLVRQGTVPLDRPQEMIHYFLRAIDNQVRDAFRQLTRQRRDFRKNDRLNVESHPISANVDSPSLQMFRREIMNQIQAELREEDRPMLSLLLSNHTWEEIGEKLHLEPDTARMRFQRAVRRVREAMLAKGPNE